MDLSQSEGLPKASLPLTRSVLLQLELHVPTELSRWRVPDQRQAAMLLQRLLWQKELLGQHC